MEWTADADDIRVLLCTAPSQETAVTIARALVTDGLAACVNIVPHVRSIYRWKGQVCDEAEQLLVIKATAGRVAGLSARIHELHPYETPELIALPLVGGLVPYLEWVRAETG